MGTLKPGATYIYEKADGITYAREFGSTDRFEIGRDYKRTQLDYDNDCRQLLQDILEEAKTNTTLQKAIDRVIIVHKLSKTKHE